MKIIIAGAGEVGSHLARFLSRDNHNVTVVDKDEKKLKILESHIDVLGVNANVLSFNDLKNTGVSDADLYIAVTENQEVNITSALLAKEKGAKKCIVRINNKEYLDPENYKVFEKLGIDYLIYPQVLASREIINLLQENLATEKIEFYRGKLSMYVLKLDEKAHIIGKSLKEIFQQNKDYNFRAVAINRNNHTIIPKGDDVFQAGDLVYSITNKKGAGELFQLSGKQNFDIKNIMILGGSRIGISLAEELQGNYNVKLIEKDPDKCEYLADILHNTLILNGDGSDTELLLDEGIKKMDAFIAVTENSETNILSCLLAKRFGVKKTIAEIENIDFIDLAENIGIDTIINKKFVAASKIYSFTIDAEVSSFKMLTGTDAEVIELIAHEGSKVVNRPLKEIDFPKDAIIGGVIRGNESIIAKGDTVIIPGDKVVVFSLPSAIHKIEKLFM